MAFSIIKTQQVSKENLQKTSNIDLCRHEIFHDIENGQILCRNCGLVFETSVIMPEWSIPNDFERDITYKKKFSITNAGQILQRALKFEHKISWSDRKRKLGKWELHRLISINQLGQNVLNRAQYLFEKAIQLEEFKFKYVTLIARVCFYYSSLFYHFSISIKELCKDNQFSIKLFGRYYYTLVQRLHLKHQNINNVNTISKICSKLRLPEEIIHKANQLRKKFINQNNTSGYNHRGISAAAIYLTCSIFHIGISQKMISKAANISDITLRSRLREIRVVCQKCR